MACSIVYIIVIHPCWVRSLAFDWLTNAVSIKLAGPWPQSGNRGGGLANEAFTGLAGLAIFCENYIGSYWWDMPLTCSTCNFNIFVGLCACMIFKVLVDTASAHSRRHQCLIQTYEWRHIEFGMTSKGPPRQHLVQLDPVETGCFVFFKDKIMMFWKLFIVLKNFWLYKHGRNLSYHMWIGSNRNMRTLVSEAGISGRDK